MGLRPLACWDCWYESRRGHGCLSLASIVCCLVEVSATGRSLVQRRTTWCESLSVISRSNKLYTSGEWAEKGETKKRRKVTSCSQVEICLVSEEGISCIFRVILLSWILLQYYPPKWACINLLATDFFFQILAHPVFKMWVIQKPNKVALWNKRHFEGKKWRLHSMFKIFSRDICWINIKWGI